MNKILIMKFIMIGLIIVNLLILSIILIFFQNSQKIFYNSKISNLISHKELENDYDYKKKENFEFIINNYYNGLVVYFDEKYFNYQRNSSKITKNFGCNDLKYNFRNSLSIFYNQKLFKNSNDFNSYKDIFNKRIILIKPDKRNQYKYVFNLICNGYMFFIPLEKT